MELIKTIGNYQMGYRVVLSMVVVHLAEEDVVAAENAYKQGFAFQSFGESDEAQYCEQFVKSFEDGDVELLNKTKKAPTVTHLETEYARLAKSLTISELSAATGSNAVNDEVGAVEVSTTTTTTTTGEGDVAPAAAGDGGETDEWDDLN